MSNYGFTMGKFDWGVWYIIIFLYIQFWTRLAAASYRGKKVRTVAFLAVRSVNKPRDSRNRIKKTRVCDLCHLHHSFILQSHRINFVLSDIANTPQFQSSCRWPLWCYRSPQDVSTWHGRCHGDNPWNIRNGVIVYGTKIVFAFYKTYWKRVMDFTLWCCLYAKFNYEFESNFWLVSLFWKLLFPFDWDLCG